SARLEIRRAGNIKDGETVIGTRAKVKVVKNKLAPPFQETEFDILYGSGISRAGEVLDLAVPDALIEKSGNHFLLRSDRLGPGRGRAVEWLRERPQLVEELAEKVLAPSPPPQQPEQLASDAAAA